MYRERKGVRRTNRRVYKEKKKNRPPLELNDGYVALLAGFVRNLKIYKFFFLGFSPLLITRAVRVRKRARCTARRRYRARPASDFTDAPADFR